jgi:Bacterial Ig-like domain
MRKLKIMLVSFVFLAIGLNTISTGLTFVSVFADKEKNQNSIPKINCQIHIDAEDHLNNNDFGPNQQQCLNNSNNIKDSTVTQTSPGDNNGDFGSPTVVSTDPSDGDNNVPVDLSEIKVTFDENIDKNSVDTGSLSVFADNCGNTFCNDPDIQDVSVSGKTATFFINSNDRLSPDTNYIARISSHIQDEDGNFLDCFNSKGVDDNCEWNFSTSGSTLNPTISLDPTSGTVLTSVTVTGNGFDPISNVVITFGGSTVATVTSTSNGGLSAIFNVPLFSSIGDQTVKATQGSNSASNTFTVTALVNPNIFLDPSAGPVGTSVDILGAGFAPSSTVTITFNGSAITTTPSTVTTTPDGVFSANFTVPSSPVGSIAVTATQGANSASKTFVVTSSLVATNQPNVAATTPSSPNLSDKMILPDIFA